MKKLLLICFLLSILISCNSQGKRPLMGDSAYQRALNGVYKDASKSPLKKKDLRHFNGLDFFAIDTTYIVEAKFTKVENAPIFKMATTTNRTPLYKEYGILNFTINKKQCELTMYQSQDNLEDQKYRNELFLPFTDATSGNESYGGGRYMDVLITEITEQNTVLLNFNNTYNPYCAYNDKYSCPLTPRKNHLDLEIRAGVKTFKKL